ncbi:uncharacterized protein BJ171DRAFT_567310 [Polychytrium aggregatum]|uniref:uncharacterized protein n=1 Tax=Polychytrium aggregatum TaxID=110093 RepID=UPI0022FE1464|nr:uncharacterized protein BJ171DRAFT_567310 [Polychytrium aggregatum]KAI9205530.1 hypothetical protein BJ171DRAFT_567310 [Polychytrium aggregatum]
MNEGRRCDSPRTAGFGFASSDKEQQAGRKENSDPWGTRRGKGGGVWARTQIETGPSQGLPEQAYEHRRRRRTDLRPATRGQMRRQKKGGSTKDIMCGRWNSPGRAKKKGGRVAVVVLWAQGRPHDAAGVSPVPASLGHAFRQETIRGECPACALMNGLGTKRDKDRAATIFEQLANDGHSDSQFWLARCFGVCHHNGYGTAEDVAKAAEWYRLSADQGNRYGQSCLGVDYLDGRGVAKDMDTAIVWLRKSADQGHPWAIDHLEKLGKWP